MGGEVGPFALRGKVHLGCGLVELDAVKLVMISIQSH